VLRAAHDSGRVVVVSLATADDGLLHAFDGMRGQKLQHANIVAGTGAHTMLVLQRATQLAEYRRQLPVAVDVGVVQRRRLAPQRHQVMQRIEDLLAVAVGTTMVGDYLPARHDRDAGHICLDAHLLKGVHARHTVAIAIEAHRLVLVHAGWLVQTGIERACRQGQGVGLLALEALANGLFLAGLPALAIAQTAGMQMRVQLVEVAHHRHRRRPGLL